MFPMRSPMAALLHLRADCLLQQFGELLLPSLVLVPHRLAHNLADLLLRTGFKR